MGHGYFRVVRALFLVAVLGSTAVHPTPTAAQYIYLDANGDGVHTAADVVPASGTATFDVWLVTDHYRNGTHALCDFDPTALFPLRSYRVLLSVGNGRVAFTDVTNRIGAFDVALPQPSTDKTLTFGWSGGSDLPPGLYRLATVSAEILQGAPRIGFTGFSETGDPVAATAFGTNCPGNENDHLVRLGEDWFDADGLTSTGPEDRAPAVAAFSPMTIAEANVATQVVSATDADGDPVTFAKVSGPHYMSVATTSSGVGTGIGQVTLAPGYEDAGTATGLVRASDGILDVDRTIGITVQETNRPAVFEQPPDLYVAAGTSATLQLTFSDPDGPVGVLMLGGPSFVQVLGARLTAEPALTQAPGSYLVSLILGDRASGGLTITRTMNVVVVGSGHPPFLDPLNDMVVTQGEREEQIVHAEDPDADMITLTGVNFPAGMTLESIGSDPGAATSRIVFAPGSSEGGAQLATVRASDGILDAGRSFMATILPAVEGATSLLLHREPFDPHAPWQTLQFNDTEGTFTRYRTAGDGVGIVFDPPAPVPDGTAIGPEVQLACLPAVRPSCLSERINHWSFEFNPPLGRQLEAGTYATSGARDSTHGTLRIASWCSPLTPPTEGTFDVRQVSFAPDGGLRSFWASYRQHVLGASASIEGFVRFNAAVAAFATLPSRFQGHVGTPIEIDIPIGGTDPSGRAMASYDLPAGAAVDLVSPELARFRWTPAEDQIGLRDIHFIAAAGTGDPDTTFMTTCVDLPGEFDTRVDVNRVELFATNRGLSASDQPEDRPGVIHPRGSGVPVAEAIGIVIGARVNGVARYASGLARDFAPGPIVAGAAAPFEARFRNYQIRPGLPHGYDWETWPRDLGAPTDASGLPQQIGDATAWSLSNDMRVHDAPFEVPRAGPPLGVEVRQTTWAYRMSGPLGDVVFQKFRFRNAGTDFLQDAYVGVNVSASTLLYQGDVGVLTRNSSACDTLSQLGYAYDDLGHAEYLPIHNSVGVVMLQGIVVSRDDGSRDTLGMTAFTTFNGYNALQGLNPDGSAIHEFFDPARPTTRFEYSGDPISSTGWVSPGTGGAFVISSGPFDLAPGAEQEIVVATVAATGLSPVDPIQELRNAASAAREAWRGAPGPPPPNHAPEIAAPDSFDVRAYDYVEFEVSASDPDGDPVAVAMLSGSGNAAFVLQESNRGKLIWGPFQNEIGRVELVFEATDTRGAATRKTVVVHVKASNRPPTASAGGVYRGEAGVPLAFDGRGSTDPDGDPLTYAWDFGDQAQGSGATPSHTYQLPADYSITLDVSDGQFTDRDSTSATIAPVDSMTASLGPGTNVIRLASAKPLTWLSLEPRGGSFTIQDVVPASITMSRTLPGGAVSISSLGSKAIVGKDADHDGIEEMDVAFTKNDLRVLFADLPDGASPVPALVQGLLVSGGRFVAPVVLTVDAGKHALAASVSPNPFNPDATLTVTTTRPGPARIRIFDVSGRMVRRLLDVGMLPAGYHDFAVSGRGGGTRLASGVYWYRVETVEGTVSGRMVLLK